MPSPQQSGANLCERTAIAAKHVATLSHTHSLSNMTLQEQSSVGVYSGLLVNEFVDAVVHAGKMCSATHSSMRCKTFFGILRSKKCSGDVGPQFCSNKIKNLPRVMGMFWNKYADLVAQDPNQHGNIRGYLVVDQVSE